MNMLLHAYRILKETFEQEDGQDLVEYALIVALIAFGALTGMRVLATGLNHAFSGISTTLTTVV